jgi:hypothetical protein
MSVNQNEIITIVHSLLQGSEVKKRALTELEKLVVQNIASGTTYRRASIEHQYTESSFQNAASRLFKDLSPIVGIRINRRNFMELVTKEWFDRQPLVDESITTFDPVYANLWIWHDRAHLVSISHTKEQMLNITEHIFLYSQHFEAIFCVEVGEANTVLELLWKLCRKIQIILPKTKNDVSALLKAIGLVLKERSVLLVLRFDRNSNELVNNFSWREECADVLVSMSTASKCSSVVTIDNNPVITDGDMTRSLSYRLNVAVNRLAANTKSKEVPRLISIDNDGKTICDILTKYLR